MVIRDVVFDETAQVSLVEDEYGIQQIPATACDPSFRHTWGDSMMMYKQQAFGTGFLWGDGVLWGDSVLWGDVLLWSANVGHTDILGASVTRWYSLFVNPNSIVNSESILAHGEQGIPADLVVGPAGAWFYPPIN